MAELFKVLINDKWIYFESAGPQTEIEQVGGFSELSVQVGDAFEQALSTIEAVTSATLARIRQTVNELTPDEIELKFGLKLGGEVGAVVAKSTGEAQFTVKIVYKGQ